MTVNSSWRYAGCAAGFGFGVVWMSVGLGSAIVCLLLAGLGYGAVLVGERARANPTRRFTKPVPATGDVYEFELDRELEFEQADDASSPLAAEAEAEVEAEYGWPLEAEIAR
jgi:hypothetical protein